MGKNKAGCGSDRFNSYYAQIYGQRWETLKKAMLKPSEPVLLSEQLRSPYYLDRASLHAALQLPVKPGDSVLDMCAAPGGKTLSIALRLNGSGKLVSNDRSSSRRLRLRNVIESCLDDNQRAIITITGHDSTKWGLYEKDTYDCVLLDAPCSSERHVLRDEKELDKWSPNRPKLLALTQFAMLAAALDAVKTGGYILYSTCSINPAEDDEVVGKLFRKRKDKFEIILNHTDSGAETTEFGQIILPDTSNGEGPLYYSLIRRIN